MKYVCAYCRLPMVLGTLCFCAEARRLREQAKELEAKKGHDHE